MKNKIKPQYGITYECYVGYTDHMESKVRKGRRFVFMGELRDYYLMISPNMKGHHRSIKKNEFVSHFIPLNLLDDSK